MENQFWTFEIALCFSVLKFFITFRTAIHLYISFIQEKKWSDSCLTDHRYENRGPSQTADSMVQ